MSHPAPPPETERFRDIFEHMAVGLHLYHLEDPDDDRSLRFIGGNPASERITGAPVSAFLGHTLDENFPALREMGVAQAYVEVARTGRPWTTEQLVYGDDRVFTAAYAIKVFPLPGSCIGVLFEDATERQRAQEELRRSEARQRAVVEALPDTLYRVEPSGALLDMKRGTAGPDALAQRLAANLVDLPEPGAVRVFELQELDRDIEVRVVRTPTDERFAIVRDITERKHGDRRKDEFISVVSHELRTPLTSMYGALGLLAGGVLGDFPPAVRALVDVAQRNTERLVRLVNDMLDLDKMEAGRVELNLAPHDARTLAAAAIEEMRGAATAADVELRLVELAPAALLGDSDRLLQVFTNLLSNAVQHSPTGEIVTLTVRPAGAGRVRFLFRDEGPGVPPDRVGRLFRKFAQVGTDGGRRHKGTGLGLAICKAIVEQHGGAIGLVDSVPPGATFFVDLPTRPGATEDEQPDLYADLRSAYAASLPAQVGALAALVVRVPRDPNARAEAQKAAHRLHGTAGTYGQDAVSAAAGALESALLGHADAAELAPLLAALQAAVPNATG